MVQMMRYVVDAKLQPECRHYRLKSGLAEEAYGLIKLGRLWHCEVLTRHHTVPGPIMVQMMRYVVDLKSMTSFGLSVGTIG